MKPDDHHNLSRVVRETIKKRNIWLATEQTIVVLETIIHQMTIKLTRSDFLMAFPCATFFRNHHYRKNGVHSSVTTDEFTF
jgi:hypothetical protein